MVKQDDRRLINRDNKGYFHFHPALENSGHLKAAIASAQSDYPEQSTSKWRAIETLYEDVFNHKAFTGRSGTMFGYEGVGSIYWHMVSKLLLAVQENYQYAQRMNPEGDATRQLADFYYRVRAGIGFNKTPENYGAFPTDPYSHTPKHAGAQQPGMTGQVKEEIITRFGELGIEVDGGAITINPSLLMGKEFLAEPSEFMTRTVSGNTVRERVEKDQLAFTLCQTLFIYECINSGKTAGIEIVMADGRVHHLERLYIPTELTRHIFARDESVVKVLVRIPAGLLLNR